MYKSRSRALTLPSPPKRPLSASAKKSPKKRTVSASTKKRTVSASPKKRTVSASPKKRTVSASPRKRTVSASPKKSPKNSPKKSPKKSPKTPKSELQKSIRYLNRKKKDIHDLIKDIVRSTPKIKVDQLPNREIQSVFAKIHENALGSYIFEYTNQLQEHIIQYDPLYMMFAENLKERDLFRYMTAKLNYLLATTNLSYQRLLSDHLKIIAKSPKSRLIPEIKKLLKKQIIYKKTIMKQENIINLVSQKIHFY